MSRPRVRPELQVPTSIHYQLSHSGDDIPLSSLSPASQSTTFSSAAYYSTPHVDDDDDGDDDMDSSETEEPDHGHEPIVVKTEEPLGLHLNEIESCSTPPLMSPTIPAKRKPGRPAKAKISSKDMKKAKVNERSKTGCMTCRKRKKKCDETKPECMNCTKTNYKCEGYPERRDWVPSSFKVKRSQSSDGTVSPSTQMHLTFGETKRPLVRLPPQPRLRLFPAIETELDSLLLEHFVRRTSRILTIHEDRDENPWLTLIVPMAKECSCLMHSILALSGAHLSRCDEQHSRMTRHIEHSGKAIVVLRDKITEAQNGSQLEPAIVAALIINCLVPIMEGDTNGQYQYHLGPLKDYARDDGSEFGRFAWQFYKQYEFCKTLTSLPKDGKRPDFHLESFERFERRPSHPGSPTSGILLASTSIRVGVLDGSFLKLVSDITHLRDRVRSRHRSGQKPPVDPLSLTSAERIDKMLWDWQSGHPKDSTQHAAALVYRNACLCYLSRTIRGARPLEEYDQRFNYGMVCLQAIPPNDSTQCTMLLPTFLLGCAAFRAHQREAIERALDNLEAYSHMGNIKPVREVLHEVWKRMDAKDESNWDWETIMEEMGYDILIN